MTLIILGAGATRGASFVAHKTNTNHCIPPLDADFFSQLQRVRDADYQNDIDTVLEMAVRLHGHNFSISMESFFSSVSQMKDIQSLTGAQSMYSPLFINNVYSAFLNSIAAVFNESMINLQTYAPFECKFHDELVRRLRVEDCIISFNYDCLIDYTLKRSMNSIWNPELGYGFNLIDQPVTKEWIRYWCQQGALNLSQSLRLLKLHGSLNWANIVSNDGAIKTAVHKWPYNRLYNKAELEKLNYPAHARLQQFSIIPPETRKRLTDYPFNLLWKQASEELKNHNEIVIIGYSFPDTDLRSSLFFKTCIAPNSIDIMYIVNPCRLARQRTRDVFKAGYKLKTRVLIFDGMHEFLKSFRSKTDLVGTQQFIFSNQEIKYKK